MTKIPNFPVKFGDHMVFFELDTPKYFVCKQSGHFRADCPQFIGENISSNINQESRQRVNSMPRKDVNEVSMVAAPTEAGSETSLTSAAPKSFAQQVKEYLSPRRNNFTSLTLSPTPRYTTPSQLNQMELDNTSLHEHLNLKF